MASIVALAYGTVDSGLFYDVETGAAGRSTATNFQLSYFWFFGLIGLLLSLYLYIYRIHNEEKGA
ncbi:MAG: hypothetical protein AAF828_08490 [Bacteroidota bacterium]